MSRKYAAFLAAACGLLAACAVTLGHPPTATLAQPGVSRELARNRAATLSEVTYTLALDLTGGDRVAGGVTIGFERSEGAAELILDFRGEQLSELVVNGVPVGDPEWRDGHLVIPRALLRVGANTLDAGFRAEIAPAGAAVIRVDEGEESFLYTLLVPSDAQLLFPSFDQPDLKARFRLTVSAPAGWRVLANSPLEQRAGEGAVNSWSFAETEPISTYLFAFAAGPWRVSEYRVPGRTDHPGSITTYLRSSQLGDADPDTIARLNAGALAWLEEYFRVPFPFAKMDLLLAPAFPFGGMEHVGAIFYNESRFVFKEPPTLNQELGRKATIYHEVAHQWFGDLVTMEWFDDLWLKEGFATFMAAKVQEQLDPGTGGWKSFHLRYKPAAYRIDATRGTTPLWQELPNLDLAKSAYGPIVYNKAPAVLKQLEFLVGEEEFRNGVTLFLRRHAYGNADWRDLLAAVELASGRSLERFGSQYILRAGMPRVEVEVQTGDGVIRSLRLVQRPATELADDPGGWWPMKVRVRLGYRDGKDVVLDARFDGESALVEGAAGRPLPDFIYPNEGDYGYGLFLPDDRSAAYLLEAVGGLEPDLLRALVWGSLWELVREARLPPARFTERVIEEFPGERDEQISAFLLSRSLLALETLLERGERGGLYPRLERLLLARAGNAELSYGLRKQALDAFLSSARSPAGLDALLGYLANRRLFNNGPIGQPSRWTALRTLLALDHPRADSLFEAERANDDSPDAARQSFIAGAAVPDAGAKREYFGRYLNDPELNEAWVTASLDAFLHPAHRDLTLPYLEPALERLEWIRENRRIFFLPQWLGSFVGAHPERRALETVDRFLAAHPGLPQDIRRKVLVERDELARTVRIREAQE